MNVLVSGLFSTAESYGRTDATLEIILMLLGAFILGYLFRYFLEKTKSREDWQARYESLKHEHELLEQRFGIIQNENRQLTTELEQCRKKLDKTKAPAAGKQAYGLYDAPAATAATTVTKTATTDKSAKDDLQVIEGIGPKIEKLLNEAGIYTWRQLSRTDVKMLRKILDDAGPRFRMHDPSSWPLQAAMAAEGRWDELQKWQEEHKYGRL